MSVQLTKKQLKEMNDCLRDLSQMKEDIEKAERVGNPHIQAIRDRYEHCKQRLELYKSEYFNREK